MTLGDTFGQALRLLLAHKLRSALTLFGIVWGTASVILLVGWGDGVRAMLERGFFKTGRNMGEVWAGKIGEDFTPAVDRRFLWYVQADVDALRRRARLPERIGAEYWQFLPVTHRQRALSLDVRGIDPEVMEIRGAHLAAGRGITHADLDHRRRVVVVGDTVRRRLLGADGGIGSRIRLAGRPFEVIGILEPLGTQLSRDRMEIDEQVWAPLATLQAHWPPWWTDDPVVSKILYRMPDRAAMQATEDEVRAILAERLGVSPDDEEAVGVWSSLEMLNQLPLDETRGLMFVLAAALLVIGGVGVLNMMLDAVHERRHEIGLRLAIGARRRDVVVQFFLETLVVTTIGGLLGAALGIGGAHLLASFELPELVPVPVLSPAVVWLALGVMLAVGVGAGVVPAWRASRIDPSLTLRME